MESQVKITLPCSIGDKLYKLKDYKIIEYQVQKITVETKVTGEGVYHTIRLHLYGGVNVLGTFSIEDSELNTTYFFDKKDITKLIVDQL